MLRVHGKAFFLLLALTGLLLTASPALAAEGTIGSDQDVASLNLKDSPAPSVSARTAEAPTLIGMAGRMALALGVVFGLMTGVLWVARRYFPQVVKSATGRGGAIEILATRSIGPRKSLMLVKAHDKTILLGITTQAIQFLTEVDQDPGLWNDVALNSGLGPDDPRSGAAGTTTLEKF